MLSVFKVGLIGQALGRLREESVLIVTGLGKVPGEFIR